MNTTIDRLVSERLSAGERRYTPARRAVVSAFHKATGPLSAAELFDALAGTVPVSSLYRTLATLESVGIVAPHHGAKGVTRYELDEWLSGHHHHIVCVACGSVEDLHFNEDQESAFESLVVDVAAAAGFSPSGHTLDIEGWCATCR